MLGVMSARKLKTKSPTSNRLSLLNLVLLLTVTIILPYLPVVDDILACPLILLLIKVCTYLYINSTVNRNFEVILSPKWWYWW